MADIKLVIKIDENTYHRIISGFANEDDAVLFEDLLKKAQRVETVTDFADRCRECGAMYGKLLEQKTRNNNEKVKNQIGYTIT